MARIQSFFSELKRRKVIHTAVVYAALAWVLIQVADTLVPTFGGSDLVLRIIVGLIIAGLPLAIFVSWAFDFTPQGFRRDTGGEGPPSSTLADSTSPFREDLSHFGLLPAS